MKVQRLLRMELSTRPVARPVTHPITTLTRVRDRRTFGRFSALRETTVWGISPAIVRFQRARRR